MDPELVGSSARSWRRQWARKAPRSNTNNAGPSDVRRTRKIGKAERTSCTSKSSSPTLGFSSLAHHHRRSHLITVLGHKIPSNTSPLLLIPPPSPPSVPLPHQALWAQLAFEELNVPALSVLPTPLASIYALGATSGIVLHIGRDRSEVAVVTDSVIRWECTTTVQVGYGDCETWFEDLLMKDEELDKSLKAAASVEDSWGEGQKAKLVKEVAGVIWTECTGEDLEVTPADGAAKAQAALAAPVPEDDSSFDVAKK